MKEICCGCSACAVICPTKAITMEIDNDGFYRPKFNSEKCIHCNLCKNVCIYKNNDLNEYNIAQKGLYSAYSKNNEIRTSTSSGGIANEISRYALEKENNVCAVVYDKKERVAKHINIKDNNQDLLEKIKGSKYIQSKNESAFKDILKNEKQTIVFGTPCQIAGFSKIIKLKKLKEKFILIDIYCHGVPSYNLWNNYLNYISKKYKMNEKPDVVFRDKKLGWHNYYIKIISKNKTYIKIRDKDIFYIYFLNSKCNSESCYECKFRNKTCSDIRLGDYWGVRYKNDDKGYSMVAINTKKGQELIDELKERIVLKKTDVKERFGQQTGNTEKPKEYYKVQEDLKNGKFDYWGIINKYKLINIKKNIKNIVKKVLRRL